MALAPALRSHAADLLKAVGPEAPTLCEGWTTRNLAAHLVTRDRRPDAMPGILIPALSGYTAKVQNARAQTPYDELVEAVRRGPGRFSPMKIPALNEQVNLIEYTTHAEDIRRAQPGDRSVALPPLPAGTDAAVWRHLTTRSKLLVRSSPVGVTLKCWGQRAVAKKATELGSITLSGSPVDVLMYLSGRQKHSGTTLEGSPSAREAFVRVRLGL